MRPFSIELAYVSGWHDGERIHIANPNDPHVVVHEDVHADILRTTPDGQLLWFSILFSSQSSLDQELIGQHIEQSRQAQESFATYVGSKSFVEKSDRLTAKRSLNTEYQAYYRLLGDILSTVVRSDCLKIALAMASMQVIFSSKSLHTWATSGFDYKAMTLDVPNSRLHMFLYWWSQKGWSEVKVVLDRCLQSQEWVVAWCNGHGRDRSLMEVVDDDDRLLSDRAFCRKLDAYVIQQLVTHLTSASPLEVISEGEWREALTLVVQEAQRREITLELEPGYNDLRAGDYRMSATSNARTYIQPSRHELIKTAERLDQELFRQHLATPKTVVGTIFGHQDQDSDQCDIDLQEILAPTDGSLARASFSAHHWITTEDAVSSLLGHSTAIDHKDEEGNLGCIVVPVSRPEVISRLEGCALNKQLCVYLDEDVFEFTVNHSANFKYGFVAFEAKNDLKLTAFWARPKVTASPYILKCMPSESGRLFSAHLSWRDDIAVVDDSPPAMVAEAIRLVTDYWTWL